METALLRCAKHGLLARNGNSLVALPHPLAWHSRSPPPRPNLPLHPKLPQPALRPALAGSELVLRAQWNTAFLPEARPYSFHPQELSSDRSPPPLSLTQAAPLYVSRVLATSPSRFTHHHHGAARRQLPSPRPSSLPGCLRAFGPHDKPLS